MIFNRIHEAYQTLSNQESRTIYDLTLRIKAVTEASSCFYRATPESMGDKSQKAYAFGASFSQEFPFAKKYEEYQAQNEKFLRNTAELKTMIQRLMTKVAQTNKTTFQARGFSESHETCKGEEVDDTQGLKKEIKINRLSHKISKVQNTDFRYAKKASC